MLDGVGQWGEQTGAAEASLLSQDLESFAIGGNAVSNLVGHSSWIRTD